MSPRAPESRRWHDSKLLATCIGVLLGALLSLLASYVSTRERLSGVESTITAMDSRLGRIESQLDKLFGWNLTASSPSME